MTLEAQQPSSMLLIWLRGPESGSHRGRPDPKLRPDPQAKPRSSHIARYCSKHSNSLESSLMRTNEQAPTDCRSGGICYWFLTNTIKVSHFSFVPPPGAQLQLAAEGNGRWQLSRPGDMLWATESLQHLTHKRVFEAECLENFIS